MLLWLDYLLWLEVKLRDCSFISNEELTGKFKEGVGKLYFHLILESLVQDALKEVSVNSCRSIYDAECLNALSKR